MVSCTSTFKVEGLLSTDKAAVTKLPKKIVNLD